MIKNRRANKWTFLLYQDSAPENHKEILDRMGVPFVLSPWHDKDINEETGNLKKLIDMVCFSLIRSRAKAKFLSF